MFLKRTLSCKGLLQNLMELDERPQYQLRVLFFFNPTSCRVMKQMLQQFSNSALKEDQNVSCSKPTESIHVCKGRVDVISSPFGF